MWAEHDTRNMVPYSLSQLDFFNLLPYGTKVYLQYEFAKKVWTVFVCEVTPVSAFTLPYHLT